MVTSCLVDSMGTDKYISAFVHNDFTLTNKTTKYYPNSPYVVPPFVDKFNKNFLQTVKSIEGIGEVNEITMDLMSVKYDKEMFSKHIDDFFTKTIIPNVEAVKESFNVDFPGYILGIDSSIVRDFNKNTINVVIVEFRPLSGEKLL